MRVAIATRIFEPEPSAASVRLAALATAFADAGHEVTVLTVRPPRGLSGSHRSKPQVPYTVKRLPVLRDRNGYVRGYVQYMSFDIPLFFRLLCAQKFDVVIAEPPPTTGFFTRFATRQRRTPYVYYAADIWADAASQTNAAASVLKVVGAIERWALRGARVVLAVSDGVERRLAELGVSGNVTNIGNGVDVSEYGADGEAEDLGPLTFVYAGTASEWHGAEVLVEAFAAVRQVREDAKLLFVGGGSARDQLAQRVSELGLTGCVEFRAVVPPHQLARALRGAAASIATCRPGAGYDFAFPTKLYSSAACGTPMVFAGPGPALDFVQTEVAGEAIGFGVPWAAGPLAEAMLSIAAHPASVRRRADVAMWARQNVSIEKPARAAVHAIEQSMEGNRA